MAGRRDTPDDIVLKLRQIEVLHGQGVAISDALRQIGVTELTYHRLRKQYGGMNRDQVKRLKELEAESQRVRGAVSDLTLDSEARGTTGSRPCRTILSEAARGTAGPRS